MSCENRDRIQVEFESNLPEADQNLLTQIVNAYEDLIETEYRGEAYKFFSQIELNKRVLNVSNKQEYCELLKKFDRSTLEYKRENVKYDSVYLSDQGEIIRIEQSEDISENELQLDEEISILPPGRTIEEEIEEIKRRGYWRFISASSFISALSEISDSKIEIQEYIEVKEAVGLINPQRMASSLIKNEIDEDNYFIKRIIAIELFIKQIRKEFECY